MKVFAKGNATPIELGTKEFLASGGEGSVYAKGGVAYKIYNDKSKMLDLGKIKELSALSLPNILRPQDVLLDEKNSSVGYSMRHVSNSSALCQLFTRAFRDRNRIDNDAIIKLVTDMQSTIKHVHSKDILIVDLNEMNFLFNDTFKEMYFIDVDSYQTKNFPATAIMESIRDRHCKNKWSELTDWFSFGIVSFQLFAGIHPYKGKHATLNGFDERMLANKSVFDKDVTVPKVCYPFSVIPQSYLDWYKAIFEKGLRLPPPNSLTPILVVAPIVKKIVGTNNFDIKEILSLPEDILEYFSHNGVTVILTAKNTYINDLPINWTGQGETWIGITPKKNNVVLAGLNNNQIQLYNANDKKTMPLPMSAEQMTSYDGRLYFKSGGSLYEIDWVETSASTYPSARIVANIHDNSKLYDGVVIQNLLGTHWATLFPEYKKSYNIKLPEIVGQVVDAKFENNVLMVVSTKKTIKGKVQNLEYNRYVYRFDSNYQTYDVKSRVTQGFDTINFTVLDGGICVSINEDQNVILFKNKKDDPLVKIIDDPEIRDNIRLYKDGKQTMITIGDTLYSIKMK